MKRVLLLTLSLLFFCGVGSSQVVSEKKSSLDNWFVGVAGGIHSSILDYSHLDKTFYPERSFITKGVFSVFAQYEFGKEKHYAVRGGFSFLRRGGKLDEIRQSHFRFIEVPTSDYEDINYSINSGYFDIRASFIYNFMKADSRIRPYVFVTPILGFSTGGVIRYQEKPEEGKKFNYELALNKGNYVPAYFAAEFGIGCRYQVEIKGNPLFIGVELGYEYGFTDTYSKKEKKGSSYVKKGYFKYSGAKVEGTRKLHGIECQITLGVPLDIFKKKESSPVVHKEYVSAPVENKPCYSLEEITDMIIRGERVEGKTICAIEDITFDFGKSEISPKSFEYLDRLATTFILINANIEVHGHTDNVGAEEFNMNLSKERAKNVVEYLISKGIKKDKITYSYHGMSQPLSTNDTAEGRLLNRRVEFEIKN